MKQTGLMILLLGWLLSAHAQAILLDGTWQFTTDSAGTWSTIHLPGSMLENGKGNDLTLDMHWTGSIYDSSWYFNPEMAQYRQPGHLKFPFWLTPARYYVGPAWYKRTIVLSDHPVTFTMERPHWETTVYIDGQWVGTQNSLSTPHQYELSYPAGKHTLMVRIDNRIKDINVGPDSHSITDHTQGNWNGVVGAITLSRELLEDVQIYPDIHKKIARIKIKLKEKGLLKLAVDSLPAMEVNTDNDSIVVDYPMGDNVRLWDEFHPNLYQLKLWFKGTVKTITFGMREFGISGTRFTINGRPIFLRGTVENAVFPLTGYPPMDEASWIRIFKKARSYGLNHMRFHSWCPPAAAFSAADKVGFYLQPEGPSWANHGTSLGDGLPVDQYIYDETNRISKAYGNYASFCMLAYGNEPRGGHQVAYLTRFIAYWKAKDNRRVYTGASVGNSWPLVPDNEFMVKAGPRGLRWNDARGTDFDYYDKIKDFQVPYITHEMGQWCVYPNFREIPKYKGVYKAKNFEIFRDQLAAHHMGKQANDFLMASGKLQVLCYKAEIEASFRTHGLAGFQLLSLNDYPGQGTALVGLLDPFWDEKGYVTGKEFSRFCSPTVILAKMKKLVYADQDTLHAAVVVTHFGEAPVQQAHPVWRIKDKTGEVLQQGTFPVVDIPLGDNIPIGELHLPLRSFKNEVTFEVSLAGISNDWPLWIYPSQLTLPATGIFICDTLNAKAQEILAAGGKVLLLAAGRVQQGKEVVQHFTPVFWNTSWFKMRPPHTLGILCDPKHPAFKDFPTEYHSNYQWWELVHNTQVMDLEDFPANYTPLLQSIDTWFLNRRLGMIVEARVGKGRLLITSIDLTKGIVARQLQYSLLRYMQSPAFNPPTVSQSVIEHLFEPRAAKKVNMFTKDSPDELKPRPFKKDQ
jgi:hypothetical protein